MRKEVLIISILIVVVVGVILFKNLNKNDQTKTDLKNGKSTQDVIIDKITFSEITNTYNNGVTTISAKMLNNSKETKNFKLKIILKDNAGKEVNSMIQIVEDLQPDKPKVLTTGVAGDYSHIAKIEFKVVE